MQGDKRKKTLTRETAAAAAAIYYDNNADDFLRKICFRLSSGARRQSVVDKMVPMVDKRKTVFLRLSFAGRWQSTYRRNDEIL